MGQAEPELRIESTSRGGVAYLRLYGPLNETFKPQALLGAVNGRHVIMNLKAVSRMTSFGLRDWVRTLDELSKRVERIVLVECAPIVVQQLNMISNFAAGAAVVSVQLPYFCAQCSWDTEITYALPGHEGHTPAPAHVQCKRCVGAMEPDESLDTYLDFAKRLAPAPLSPELAAFVRDFTRAIDEPGRPLPSNKPLPARLLMTTQSIVIRLPNLGRAISGTARSRWAWLVGHPRIALVVLALLVAAGIVIVTLRLAPVGLPPEQMALFNEHVQAQRFVEAEALAARFRLTGALTPALDKQLAEQISEGRRQALARHRQQMPELLVARKWAEVIEAAGRAAAIAPLDADGAFVVAEAHRQLENFREAETYYTQFADTIAESNPDDARIDDALFWKAEALAATGQIKEARKLFRVLAFEMPGTEFRRPARKRLRTLARQPARAP